MIPKGSRSVLLSALVLMGLTTSLALGQPAAVFHAETRLVVVQLSVHNSRGEAVTNLDRRAFTVYENGKQQPVPLFLGDDAPVSLGIVIDNSGSMRGRRAAVEAAALSFARAANSLDELFVVNFADTPHLDVEMTTDLHAVEAGISRADSIGGTALRDAVDLAERYLCARAKRERRVLLVITDGDDNASTISLRKTQQQAVQNNIAIYSIGLPHADRSNAARAGREVDELAERTGGLAVHVSDLSSVGWTAIDLAHQIRQQYTLGYTPMNPRLDGSYRRIRVVVKSAGRLTVHTRAGYFATALSPKNDS
ncbi:MAG: VWA domain-containing protein [Acidobacteria bacterium]|nr:MAG: VWA domain-containing protein [Acidobacteriota bacterium]